MAFGKERPVNWRTFGICVLISLGQFVSAYASIIIGTTIGKADFMTTMALLNAEGEPEPDFSVKLGEIVGLFQAGAVVGILIGTVIVDKWGRKAGVIYSSIVSIIGLAGLTGSVNSDMFVAFRFIMGAGAWGYASVSVLYTSELAPPEYRGFFAGLNGVMIGAGCAAASYVGMGFYFSPNVVAQWRAPFGIIIVIPVAMLCFIPFIPESPRYLLLKGRTDEAWKVVSKLHDVPSDPEQVFAREEFFQMTKQTEYDRQQDTSWVGLFKKASYRKRLYLGCTLAFFGQSTAVFVIANYGTQFYKTLGFSLTDQQILQGNRDTIALVGNMIGSVLVDRVGRKKIMLFGFIGCLVCLIVEAIMVALYTGDGTPNVAGQNTGVAFLYIYLAFYASGVDVGTFVFLGEMFPNHIRAKGLALSLATLCATACIYLTTTEIAFAALGWKFFMVFVALTTCGIIWIILYIPETMNVPLEEMGAMFGDEDEVMVFLNTVHLDPVTHKPVVDGEKAITAGDSKHVEIMTVEEK